MKTKRVKFTYDATDDAAYLKLGSGKVIESEEVQPGLIVDYDGDDQIVGVEILRFRARFAQRSKGEGAAKTKQKALRRSA
jgi:uncharacterized protein YuzE